MGSRSHQIEIQLVSRLKGIPSELDFKKWLAAALPRPAELSLRVVNGVEGRQLNSGYRGKDYATNVLTFTYHEKAAPRLIGDIVLCAPVVAREAREQGKSLQAHYAHLTVHGALHLAGMDHEITLAAIEMETMEITVLAKLGYGNPYALDGE
jgi:probable rRNA maturation factor